MGGSMLERHSGHRISLQLGRDRVLSADLDWVYGAALNASSSEESAAEAARAAIAQPAPPDSRRELMARAVAYALDSAPAEPLSALPPPEREALGLARIVGMS